MKFKPFQKTDYARLAMVNGAILAHDTGLGKTWAMFLWPLLKAGYTVTPAGRIVPNQPILLLVPGDLHDKTVDAGRDIFRTDVVRLDHQDTFLALLGPDRRLPAGFYLTSYTQLGVNGVAKPPSVSDPDLAEVLSVTAADLEDHFAHRGEHYAASYETLACSPFDSRRTIMRRYLSLREDNSSTRAIEDAYATVIDFHADPPAARFGDLPEGQRQTITHHYLQVRLGEAMAGVGTHPDGKPKCVYSPTLADLCAGHFHALVIDEGVKIKGEHTLIGKAARQLRTPCSLILSATPIKNRLPDIYRLAWLAAGGHKEATARFPYADSESDRDDFAETFCVSERNLSKEAKTDRRWVKLTPQVCNVHRVWKLFGPIILRRRKKDIGHELVKKTKHIIRVPMGRQQAQVYRYHLEAEYLDVNRRKAVGAQLQALRAAAAAPTSDSLCQVRRPKSEGEEEELPFRSTRNYTPKMAAILQLVHQAMARREQIIVFSSLHEPLDVISARLTEAGVRHVKLDGRMTQARRGKASAQFRQGPPAGAFTPAAVQRHIPVMLASSECMAEGHDWPKANNVVQADYPWAMDKVLQSVDRAYRLNSEKDLNYWPIITEGTIERRMESMCDEKADASELVLDGHLLGETPDEMNLAELLKTAAAEFDHGTQTIPEESLEAEWPALRVILGQAQRIWDYGDIARPIESTDTTSTSVGTAPAASAAPVIVASAAPPEAVAQVPTDIPTNIIPMPPILPPPAPVVILNPWRRRLAMRQASLLV